MGRDSSQAVRIEVESGKRAHNNRRQRPVNFSCFPPDKLPPFCQKDFLLIKIRKQAARAKAQAVFL